MLNAVAGVRRQGPVPPCVPVRRKLELGFDAGEEIDEVAVWIAKIDRTRAALSEILPRS